jgi:membrane-bound lytic murein transglycosylase B
VANWPDVFASIANYFKVHGWRSDQPVLADASIDSSPDDPAAARVTLNETVASLRRRGYRFDTTLPDSTPAMLMPAALEQGIGASDSGFFVITRYNRSPLRWPYMTCRGDRRRCRGPGRHRDSAGTPVAPAP